MMIPFRKLAKDRVTLRRDIHDIYVFIIVIYTKTEYVQKAQGLNWTSWPYAPVVNTDLLSQMDKNSKLFYGPFSCVLCCVWNLQLAKSTFIILN